MLGHDGPPEAFWRENLITGEPLARCPVRTLLLADEAHPALAREVARYLDTYYPAYKDHHLLVAGGITDQPARYLALINRIRTVDARTQAKLEKITADPDAS